MQVHQKNYQVIRFISDTRNSENYLVTDGEKKYVARVLHAEAAESFQYSSAVQAELAHYQQLEEAGINMPAILETDEENNILLTEFIDGEDVFGLVLNDRLDPHAIDQVYEMSEKAEKHGINLDYFPTNFVFCAGRLYYVEYECAPYMDEWNLDNWGIQYWQHTPELDLYLKEFGSEMAADFSSFQAIAENPPTANSAVVR